MEKVVLLSYLVGTIAIPMAAAADPVPRRGLSRTITWFSLFSAAYLFALLFIYPRLG